MMTPTPKTSIRRTIRVGFLAVLLISCASLVSAHAQEQPAPAGALFMRVARPPGKITIPRQNSSNRNR